MAQEWMNIIQTIGVIAAVCASFSAYRARDNARAATLAVIQADIRAIGARLDALEDRRRAGGAPRNSDKKPRSERDERRSA